MQLTDLWTSAAIELGIRSDQAGEKQTSVTRWANQAILEILRRTDVNIVTATMATIVGCGDYDLPQSILRIKKVIAPDASGNIAPLDFLSIEQVNWLRRTNTSDAARGFSVKGMNLLLLWPTPGSIYNISVDYVPRPTKLAVSTDDPALPAFGKIPEEFHMAIEQYVYYRGAAAGDDQSAQQGLAYRAAFENEIREIKRQINRHGGRLGPAQVGRRSRVALAWRNDQA